MHRKGFHHDNATNRTHLCKPGINYWRWAVMSYCVLHIHQTLRFQITTSLSSELLEWTALRFRGSHQTVLFTKKDKHFFERDHEAALKMAKDNELRRSNTLLTKVTTFDIKKNRLLFLGKKLHGFIGQSNILNIYYFYRKRTHKKTLQDLIIFFF